MKKTLLTLTALLTLAGTAQARTWDEIKKSGTIKIATEGAFPPFNVLTGKTLGGFEVDLDRQLLIATAHGRLYYILNTSTGSGERYYSGGRWKVLVIATEERYLPTSGGFFSTGNHPVETFLPIKHLQDTGFGIDIATPSGFLFVAFRIPYSPAVGVKLIATPWTDANLQHVEGIAAEELRQEHRAKGMPESLVEVLHLAALADVRMLVFDADAPVLDGLTLYDDE